MEKKITKKILAIIMILMLISTDFFVLGLGLKSYALESSSTTNNKNIEFSAYFKNERGEKVEKLQTSIKNEKLKLYAEITVKNEGYLCDASLELQNSNFKIKDNILSDLIASINQNKVNLKQINAGETAVIELDIEPSIGETLTEEMLLEASDLKLTGKYMETSYKGLSIEATRNVALNLQADENATAELNTDIITNKIFSIDGKDKRVVQLLVKSRLADNQYPIKQTKINVDIPKLGEEEPEKVEVLSLGTNATNGKTSISTDEWKKENDKVEITIKNEDDTIKWNKNSYDEIVITYIYDKNVDTSKIEINSNSEITVHNNGTKYTAKYTKGIENSEPNGIVTTESKASSEGIYKGQIASNISAQYNTTTTLKIANTEIPEKVTIKEQPDVLKTENSELTLNTKYISTKINKAKMLEILGQDGNISIKAGTTTTAINKDTETNENGDVVINYETPVSEIEITTSKPENTGILEINHTKATAENTYTMEQLSNAKTLQIKNTVKGTRSINKVEQTEVENSSESSIEVKDTVSKAEFTVNKDTLSTMTVNKNVVFGVKLITNGVQYDLYKNPTIKVKLPSSVENVTINGATPLYAEEFKVNSKYDNTNKILEINLKGEQTAHSETDATQLYLQLDLDITLSKLASSKKDKIIMTYTNENATQYESETTGSGIIEKEIEISAPSGLITMHNSSTYNIEGIKGINDEKQLIQIENKDAGKEINFNIALVNNIGQDAKNVKIFGKLPTKGNKISGEENANTLETALKAINAPNATIYYSENVNATTDVGSSANGWTTTISANTKVFLIVLEQLNKESSYMASYAIQMPSPIQKDATSYAEYEVTYDTDTDKNLKTRSTSIGFATPTEIKLETSISAQVGNDVINNGDTIRAGEVIRYTMSVKNNGAQKLENIELKSNVPDGTVYVTPVEEAQHAGATYYKENESIKEIKEKIQTLEAGKTYTKTYEVRVKSDIATEKQISNKTIATCEGTDIESNELTNKLIASKVRVTIKELKEETEILKPSGTLGYMVIVDNLTNEDITKLDLKLNSSNFETKCLSSDELYAVNEDIPETINIEKIPANGYAWYKFQGNIQKDADKLNAIAVVNDSENNIYRSNRVGEELPKVGAKINLSSAQDKAYIKEGDKVEYIINVENTGDCKTNFEVVDNVSEYLEVQSIYENDKIVLQSLETAKSDTYVSSIDNKVSHKFALEVGGKITIKISAIVKSANNSIDALPISNKAEVRVNQVTKATSEEVTHILKLTAENVKNVINGKAWLDQNINGAKDNGETTLQGIKVKLYDVSTNDYLKDANGSIIETTTNENGEYGFTKIPNGQYIVLFEYDTNEYEPTYYKKDGVDDSINSKVVLKNITINGETKTYAVTDTINLQDNISNINIGLKEKLVFDLQLDKYISKVSIQNKKGTKSYDYNDATFAKVEIYRKQVAGTVVVLEYTIKVKNNGEIAGYAKNVKDYLSNGLTFSSELNPDWYLSGNELYTSKFSNETINPGEEKEVKLILTKTMTNENTGVVNNRAEIVEAYNEYGIADSNSTPNNNMAGENDLGSADVIIGVSTGGTILAYVILVIINTILIAIAIKLMIKNKIITLKKERR